MAALLPQSTLALPSDNQQPVHVKGDSAIVNRNTGISTFIGNAKAAQGTALLTGDTIIVQNNKHRQVDKITAIGDAKKLAHYETLPHPNDKLFKSWAITIKYLPIDGIAHLIEDALAIQTPNTYKGPIIDYDVKQQIVSSPKSKAGDASIVINPNKLPG